MPSNYGIVASSFKAQAVLLMPKLLVNVSGGFYSSRYTPYSLNYGPVQGGNFSYTAPDYDVSYIEPQTITVTLTGTPESGPGESQPLSDKPLIITRFFQGNSLPPQTLTTDSNGQVTFTHPSYWGEPQYGYVWNAESRIIFEGDEETTYPAIVSVSQTFYNYNF